MSIEIKTIDFEPKRHTFGHVARRLGADKPASRYQEATFDLQATDNFHYKPLWEPEHWAFDPRKTAVVMEDWYKPLDPRQYYYATYNIARANMQQAVEKHFSFVSERGLLSRISEDTRANILRGLIPSRHLHWGSNMNMSEICQRAWGAAIASPAIFSAMDHLGMAQIISRIGLELDGQTGVELEAAREAWLGDPAWQGVRRLIEDTFVERDWFGLFTAQALGVNGVLFSLINKGLEPLWAEAAIPVAMLTEFVADWRAEEARWTDSVIKVVAAESDHNRDLVSGWASQWIGRAEEAAVTLSAGLLNDDGEAGRLAATELRKKAAALGLKVED